MNIAIARVEKELQKNPKRWAVTGCAGFIGSNLVEYLLALGQDVIGLDNFSTGKRDNLADLERTAGENRRRFTFVEGDIRSSEDCKKSVHGCDYVLHEAALGSVPKSIEDPVLWNDVNVGGFVNMLVACRDAGIRGFVYASSSSVYGDSEELPKVESKIGMQLSPYAVSKYANELYAEVFARCYGFRSVGLRYFNVFGKRQDPDGAYAAVIPRWLDSMKRGDQTVINGDGKTSRDFCYISNVIQANILAATRPGPSQTHAVYNVGVGERTDLLSLHEALRAAAARETGNPVAKPVFGPERAGDVKHSLASKDAIELDLGYRATHTLAQGIAECLPWYLS